MAIEGADYALAGTRTVTVPAELSAGSVQLRLVPIQDREVEAVETVQFTAAADGFADQTGSLELTDDDIGFVVECRHAVRVCRDHSRYSDRDTG